MHLKSSHTSYFPNYGISQIQTLGIETMERVAWRATRWGGRRGQKGTDCQIGPTEPMFPSYVRVLAPWPCQFTCNQATIQSAGRNASLQEYKHTVTPSF